MITTGCEGCCFLTKNGNKKGCAVSQLCVVKDNNVFAPGYCRYCRSHKWLDKQEGITKTGELIDRVVNENKLQLDLLVFFDERINSVDDLCRTLGNDWYVPYTKRVIIVDVTGFGHRKNLALQYLKRTHHIPTIVDSSVANESFLEREDTIKRISKQVTSPFFMAIPAGSIVRNMELLANNVQNIPSRVIQWSFPSVVGGTMVIPDKYKYGLFITKPYTALIRSPKVKSFSEQIKIEERETEMGLSWLCQDCLLI